MRDAPPADLFVQAVEAPNELLLVVDPAVNVNEPQATEPRGVPIDHVHGIPAPPAGPHLGPPFSGVQVEREINSELLAPRLWPIVRGHADRVQPGPPVAQAAICLPPDPVEPVRGT